MKSIRQARFVVHDRIKDRFVRAFGVFLFLDLRAADSDSLGVGEQLLGQFRNRDDVDHGRLGNVVAYPPV
ncbi:hypothetical protein [Mesorhizobium sp. M8A.F.Ca.ET.057.01.1.1]|uniref:hypothetical protein n=1 Tax=Mesorhizobium sp. M8A.F.Ca.ET.057.01.1.1 TaxID=2493679 RepID=UPI003A881784